MAFADQQGTPLSALMTVSWQMMPGFALDAWSRHQTRMVKSMTAWLKRRDIPVAFAWTREVSGQLWGHSHFLLHLPRRDTAQTARDLAAHLTAAFGFEPGGVDLSIGVYGMWSRPMRAGAARYLLKGADHRSFRYLSPTETENIASALGIEHRGNQGVVTCKRAGVSETISRAARRRAGWRERRSLDELRQIIRPPQPRPRGVILGRRGRRDVLLPEAMPRTSRKAASSTHGRIPAAPKPPPGTASSDRGADARVDGRSRRSGLG